MIYETGHRGCTTMSHHRHATPFVTIVLSGGYVEVNGAVPEYFGDGAVVLHAAGEEHADRFASDTRCLNVELSDDVLLPGTASAKESPALLDAGRCIATAFRRNLSELPAAVEKLQSDAGARAIAHSEARLFDHLLGVTAMS